MERLVPEDNLQIQPFGKLKVLKYYSLMRYRRAEKWSRNSFESSSWRFGEE